jgi:hypothetical protein
LNDARAYATGFKWCHGISESYFGFGVGGVVAVFLFRIEPTSGTDEWLWVVVGDLPSAYLVTDQSRNGKEALRVYCNLMEEWITATRGKGCMEDAFPVATDPSPENIAMLESRVEFLKREVLPHVDLPSTAARGAPS